MLSHIHDCSVSIQRKITISLFIATKIGRLRRLQSPDDVSACEISHWPALVAWCWLNNQRMLPGAPDRRHRLVQVAA